MQMKFWWVYKNHHFRLSVCPSVHLSCKRNSSFMDEPILMKLYTVVVYKLRRCMRAIILAQTCSREIISSAQKVYIFVI